MIHVLKLAGWGGGVKEVAALPPRNTRTTAAAINRRDGLALAASGDCLAAAFSALYMIINPKSQHRSWVWPFGRKTWGGGGYHPRDSLCRTAAAAIALLLRRGANTVFIRTYVFVLIRYNPQTSREELPPYLRLVPIRYNPKGSARSYHRRIIRTYLYRFGTIQKVTILPLLQEETASRDRRWWSTAESPSDLYDTACSVYSTDKKASKQQGNNERARGGRKETQS